MPVQMRFEHLLIAILLYLVFKNLWHNYQIRKEKQKKKSKNGPPRQWKPRNPKKCPACRAGVCLPALHPKRKVTPWKQVKSTRGRQKRIDTQGHCCLNPRCAYFSITDATIHALVGNGKGASTRIFSSFVARLASTVSPRAESISISFNDFACWDYRILSRRLSLSALI